jgi:hypothetical protein
MAQAARMTIEVTKMIEPAKAVLAPAGNTLSEAWAGVIGDRVAAWRLKNAAALQVKVNEECAALGLKVDRAKIPERYAIAWFEEATKQDEPEIQTLFARLLARATAGDDDAGDRRLLAIVSQLTPIDAKVLEWLFKRVGHPTAFPQIEEFVAWREVKDEFGERALISLDQFVVLGIFERQYSLRNDAGLSSWHSVESGMSISRLAEDITGNMTVTPDLSATPLGLALYKACLSGNPQEVTGG